MIFWVHKPMCFAWSRKRSMERGQVSWSLENRVPEESRIRAHIFVTLFGIKCGFLNFLFFGILELF